MAAITGQRIVESRFRRVKFWAWTISVFIHVAVLGAFGVVKFSRSDDQGPAMPVPVANVSRSITEISASILPKPKIKPPAGRHLSKNNKPWLSEQTIIDDSGVFKQDLNDYAGNSESVTSFDSGRVFSGRVEFFGSKTYQRKICYVVDCSGSMRGMLRLVQNRLKDSIRTLMPDQYFSIIFFGDERLLEFGGGVMLRATANTKSSAVDFIDSIEPAGRTNALEALKRAVEIRDSSGDSPSVIFFLTDGFELTNKDRQMFSFRIADLLRRFAPATKINTIGFWPDGDDRAMLETIAKQSGGEFVFVSGREN